MRSLVACCLFSALLLAVGDWAAAQSAPPAAKSPLTVVVLDPLSKELACDCVSGYAQRDYTRLGAHLEALLQNKVKVVFSESLSAALKDKTDGQADVIIGKDSVVRADIKSLKLKEYAPIASLTDSQGVTTMRGLFVVRGDSPAVSLLDLDGFQVLFGPEKCDEKYKAPRAALKKLEIDYQAAAKPCETCSVAAKELVALPKTPKPQL